jgi:hypothetical protein
MFKCLCFLSAFSVRYGISKKGGEGVLCAIRSFFFKMFPSSVCKCKKRGRGGWGRGGYKSYKKPTRGSLDQSLAVPALPAYLAGLRRKKAKKHAARARFYASSELS